MWANALVPDAATSFVNGHRKVLQMTQLRAVVRAMQLSPGLRFTRAHNNDRQNTKPQAMT